MLYSSINSFSISLICCFNYKSFCMQSILNCIRTGFHRTLNLLIQVPLMQQDEDKQLQMNSCLSVSANGNATVSCADSAACNPAIQLSIFMLVLCCHMFLCLLDFWFLCTMSSLIACLQTLSHPPQAGFICCGTH